MDIDIPLTQEEYWELYRAMQWPDDVIEEDFIPWLGI